MKFEKLELQAN